MDKSKFLFPVEERPICFGNDKMIMTPADWNRTEDYKAIVRTDNGKLISVVRDSYSLTTNEEVLENTLGILEKLNVPYVIDPLSSYCNDERMVCHAIFKDLTFKDSESPVHLSMFVHNSYDMSQKFKFRFGTYRLICSNGALLYSEMGTSFKKHTLHFVVAEMEEIIQKAMIQFPSLYEKIANLQETPVNLLKFKPIAEKIMGKPFTKHMKDTKGWKNINSFYDLYNEMTWYTTHKITPIMKEFFFEKISKAFKI